MRMPRRLTHEHLRQTDEESPANSRHFRSGIPECRQGRKNRCGATRFALTVDELSFTVGETSVFAGPRGPHSGYGAQRAGQRTTRALSSVKCCSPGLTGGRTAMAEIYPKLGCGGIVR